MISLTDKAIEIIADTIEHDPTLKDKYVRIGVMGGGCSGFQYQMDFDNLDPEDITVDFGSGVKVCIDHHSAGLLDETTVDYIQETFKEGFVFNNKKANRVCGCGKSFN